MSPGETNYIINGMFLALVNEQILNTINRFIHLGSTLTSATNIDVERHYRIAEETASFGRLQFDVWIRRDISIAAGIKVSSPSLQTCMCVKHGK